MAKRHKRKNKRQRHRQDQNKSTTTKNLKNKYENWWIMCIYFSVPIALILMLDSTFSPKLIEYMSVLKLDGYSVQNSDYAINKIYSPFAKSLSLLSGVILSYIILKFVQKVLIRKKIYFQSARTCLKYIEIGCLFMAVIIAIYSRAMGPFETTHYGYDVETIKAAAEGSTECAYVPLEHIPSKHSENLSSPNASIGYKILSFLSMRLFHIVDRIDFLVAVIAAILVPLKSYVTSMGKRK